MVHDVVNELVYEIGRNYLLAVSVWRPRLLSGWLGDEYIYLPMEYDLILHYNCASFNSILLGFALVILQQLEMNVDQEKGSINYAAEKTPSAVDDKLRDLAGEDEIDFGDLLYKKKARLLNAAMQETGMGRYQWYVRFYVYLTQFD